MARSGVSIAKKMAAISEAAWRHQQPRRRQRKAKRNNGVKENSISASIGVAILALICQPAAKAMAAKAWRRRQVSGSSKK
jgi:hypothetical protein